MDLSLCLKVDKGLDGKLTKTTLMGVIYVPLTDKDHQWPRRSAISSYLRQNCVVWLTGACLLYLLIHFLQFFGAVG
jgi:hypothetical protein